MKKLSCLMIFCLVVGLVSTAPVPARAVGFDSEYTLEIPCYAPTKIAFNYDYTHNHSIRDISTLGASLYTHTGGPTYIEFNAQDVDTYRFTIELKYTAPRNQTIIVAIWSGTLPMQGLQFKSHFETVVIWVTLRVMKEPTYPTDEEVAQAVIYQIQKDLQETYTAINDAISSQNAAVVMNSFINFAAVLGVVVLSLAYYMEKRRGRVQGVNP